MKFHGHLSRFLCAALALALGPAICVPEAYALERVTLRNGFSYDCARQESLDAGHVRLYLTGETPASTLNFIDLPTESIASVEAVPDPPRAPIADPRNPSTGLPDVHSLLARAATLHDIDAELLASIVHAESGGRAAAISHAGAVGLMQLMPATAQALGVADARRPEDNIAGGTAYLDALLERYHENLALALAAYNAGPAAVDRYHGVPPFGETRAYVARVMADFKRRKLALERSARASR